MVWYGRGGVGADGVAGVQWGCVVGEGAEEWRAHREPLLITPQPTNRPSISRRQQQSIDVKAKVSVRLVIWSHGGF